MPKKRKEYRDVEPTLAEKKKITNTLRQYLDREVKLREDIVREKKGKSYHTDAQVSEVCRTTYSRINERPTY